MTLRCNLIWKTYQKLPNANGFKYIMLCTGYVPVYTISIGAMITSIIAVNHCDDSIIARKKCKNTIISGRMLNVRRGMFWRWLVSGILMIIYMLFVRDIMRVWVIIIEFHWIKYLQDVLVVESFWVYIGSNTTKCKEFTLNWNHLFPVK